MFNYIIFDVDGTILDTEKAILSSLQQVLQEEEMHYSTDELRFALGIPGKETLRQLGLVNIDQLQLKWAQTVLDFSQEVHIFEGLVAVIESLSQASFRMGIVTSKTTDELSNEFEPFGLNSFFDYIVSADDTVKHKPHPDPLLLCLDKFKANVNEALYIGDSIYDMQCAKRAGAKFALALWGAKKIEGFESADFILNEPKDILKLLLK